MLLQIVHFIVERVDNTEKTRAQPNLKYEYYNALYRVVHFIFTMIFISLLIKPFYNKVACKQATGGR